MKRTFIELQNFLDLWYDCGLTDEDLVDLEAYLCDNPESGNVMQGTGGIRKIRFALKGRGKRGSARVIYIDFASYEKIYLLDVYTKNEKTDLSPDDKEKLKKVVKILEDSLRRKG